MEEWKSIPDYPNYEVSNNGFVRNSNGVILKAQQNKKKGYMQVILWKDSKAKACYLHRLVAESFVAKDDDKQMFVDFKDGDITNNNADNLYWKNVRKNQYQKKEGVKYFG